MSKQMDNMCRTCILYNTAQGEFNLDTGQTAAHTDPVNEREVLEIRMFSLLNVPHEIKEQNICFKELLKTIMPQLKLDEKDELPQKVCSNCSDKILNFYNFQRMCLRNEEKLFKLLEQDEKRELEDDAENNTVILVKTEVVQTCSNQNDTMDFVNDEKEIENELCSDDDSNKSDILALSNIIVSDCYGPICSISGNSVYSNKKEKNVERKSKRCVKKKLKQNSSKRSNRYVKRNPKELFSCDKCQRKLKSEESLMKHQELHLKKDIEEKELKCSICNEDFPDIGALKEHQRTHTFEKTLCSECGKSFASAGSLKQHSLRHLDTKLYPCPDCPKAFPTSGDLLCHYETHKAKPRIHVCDKCGRGFYKPFLLKQHQRYHNDERPFGCEFCEKRFVTSEKQRRHVRTHTGEKPYRCKYCNRAFTQSNDCIKHLRQHLGDNVYQCELCPLRFPMARSLRAHFASHKDDDDDTRSRNLKARMEEERNFQIKFINREL